jgi:hypothetical protein
MDMVHTSTHGVLLPAVNPERHASMQATLKASDDLWWNVCTIFYFNNLKIIIIIIKFIIIINFISIKNYFKII